MSKTGRPGQRKAALPLLFLLALLLLPKTAASFPAPLPVGNLGSSLDLTGRIEIVRDPTGRMGLDEALRSESRFAPLKGGVGNFGYSRDRVWARFRLYNESKEKIERYLEYAYPPINLVELFWPNGEGGWNSLVLGNTRPFYERPIDARSPVFPILLKPGEDSTFYVRVSTSGTLDLRFVLWRPDAFHARERESQIVYGLFFGVILIMGLYHLFLNIYLRDPASLAYLAFTLGFCSLAATIRGFSFEYAFGAFPAVNNAAMPVSIGLADLTGGIFTRIFLSTKRELPRLDRVLLAFIAGSAIVIVLGPFLPYSLIVPAAAALTFPGVAILFSAGLASLRRGQRVARFYTVAWGALLAGVAITALHAFGFLPPGFLASYGLELGAAAQVVLLALSLADRLQLARAQNDELRSRAYEEQKRTAQSFARFVPHEFLESLGKDSVLEVELGDHAIRCMSVLFSDIRAFTTLLEAMSAEEAFRFINSYMSRVGPLVRQSGGFIDKYIGDAIMALFPEKPERALESAISMQRALVVYNAHRHRSGFRPIHVGMGLHYGRLSIGTVGERNRMDTTVISDAVNIASRLEGLTKRYGAHIIASGTFMEAVAGREAFATRYLGSHKTKGKRRVVEVHEVLDTLDERTREERLANAALVADASTLMAEARWSEAADLLAPEIPCSRDPAIDVLRWECARALARSRLPRRGR